MSMRDPSQKFLAVLKVVGVGGGGSNAVNRMVDAGLTGCEFIAVNTDAQALLMTDADVKLQIGTESTRGLGAGAEPGGRTGRSSREPRRAEGVAQGRGHGLRDRGRGRRHRDGRRPDVAELAREIGAITVGVVTRPFSFEGRKRAEQAELGIRDLRENVDTLIVIENDRLLQVVDKDTSIVDAFRMADDVLRQGVQGITDLITIPGLVNLDFADVRTIMRDAGSALMGIGVASGEGRAGEAARMAVSSPLLEASIEGATGILLNVTGGTDMGLFEVNEAAEVVTERGRPERERHLRRRDRPGAQGRGARDRDRDGLRPGALPATPARGASGRRGSRAGHADEGGRRVRRARRRARGPVLPARRLTSADSPFRNLRPRYMLRALPVSLQGSPWHGQPLRRAADPFVAPSSLSIRSRMQTLLRTPLYERHVALGARMVPFAGWEMPVQYEGVIPEHRAVREDCGVFDVSHMGRFEFEGPKVPRRSRRFSRTTSTRSRRAELSTRC